MSIPTSPDMLCWRKISAEACEKRLSSSALERLHAHIHLELMAAAADDHAAKGRHITEIPVPRERDVILSDHAIIGGVKVQPAERGTVHRHPGMRGITADRGLAALAHGSDIATYIGRRESG